MSQVISASQVKELRDLTGAGMMTAKRALEETGGDIDAAQRLLREQGIAAAGKKAGRETTEGIVLSTVSGNEGVLVAIGCETEPVSKRLELIGRIGENVEIRGASRLEAADGELLAEYVHPPANKVGVIVRVKGGDPTLARRIAMHISFAAPRYRTVDEVPQDEIASEREIYAQQPDVLEKPEQVREKIVEGRLRKEFLANVALSEQTWIHDTAKTVGQALGEAGVEVVEFARYALAE